MTELVFGVIIGVLFSALFVTVKLTVMDWQSKRHAVTEARIQAEVARRTAAWDDMNWGAQKAAPQGPNGSRQFKPIRHP